MSNYIHSNQTLEKKTQGPNKEPQRLVILVCLHYVFPQANHGSYKNYVKESNEDKSSIFSPSCIQFSAKLVEKASPWNAALT